MGASSNLVSTALVGVIAQRLVRTICPHCRMQYQASAAEKAILFPHNPQKQAEPLILQKGKGCDLCGNKGFSGRSGLYEILMVDREIRQLINNNHSDLEIEDAAIAAGMKTLALCGREKVILGETTLDEVQRVLGPGLGG